MKESVERQLQIQQGHHIGRLHMPLCLISLTGNVQEKHLIGKRLTLKQANNLPPHHKKRKKNIKKLSFKLKHIGVLLKD